MSSENSAAKSLQAGHHSPSPWMKENAKADLQAAAEAESLEASATTSLQAELHSPSRSLQWNGEGLLLGSPAVGSGPPASHAVWMPLEPQQKLKEHTHTAP